MLKIPILNKLIPAKKQPKGLDVGDVFFSVDIGTELLKGLLCRITPTGVEILGSSHIWQQHHAMRSGVIQNIATVTSNLELMYNELVSKYQQSTTHSIPATTPASSVAPQSIPIKSNPLPTHAIMGIAGEIVSGEPIMVSYDRGDNSSVDITPDEAEGIITNVRENVIANGVEDLARRLSLAPEDIVPLHIDLSTIEIGNVRVKDLVGYKGKSIKLYFNAVFAPYTLVEALISAIRKLNLEIISVVAQPIAVARAFKGSDDINFDGIFMDIGGGTTDIAIIKKGTIVDSYMFAFGGRVFTERLAKEMNLDYRFAEQRKQKYSQGLLPKNIEKEVKDILRPDVSLWADGVRIALSQFAGTDPLPSTVYLCGGGSLLPDIKEIMLAYPFKQYVKFLKHPKAQIITPADLANCVDVSAGIKDSVIDVTPAAIATYAWSIYNEPNKHLSLKL